MAKHFTGCDRTVYGCGETCHDHQCTCAVIADRIGARPADHRPRRITATECLDSQRLYFKRLDGHWLDSASYMRPGAMMPGQPAAIVAVGPAVWECSSCDLRDTEGPISRHLTATGHVSADKVFADAAAAYGGFAPADPFEMPLGPKFGSWAERERAVEWVLHNFSAGQLALLYKLLHDGHGLRRAAVDEKIKKESKA